jgi:DNA polymerase
MKKIVFGEGPRNAKLVFIGEAPGATEIKIGRPFVGRAGKFLDKELSKFGIERKKIYITNVVKERVIGPPNKKQIKKWLPILKKELNKIRPKIVVLLGRTAAKNVPKNLKAIYIELPHPAAAMRFTKQKIKFVRGLAKIKKLFASSMC